MTTSGVLSRIRSALGRAHHISTASAKGNPSNKPSTPAPEGAIPFTVDGEIHQTWYRVCGDFASSKSAPLVVVHGGKRSDSCGCIVGLLTCANLIFPPLFLFCSALLASGQCSHIGYRPFRSGHGPRLPHSRQRSAKEIRPVILFDQLGNSRSTHLPNKPKSFWTSDLFVDELINLLDHSASAHDTISYPRSFVGRHSGA